MSALEKQQEQKDILFALKYGFKPTEVVVQVEPQDKKSCHYAIMLYNKKDTSKTVEIGETYRWGRVYMDGTAIDCLSDNTTRWHHNINIPDFPPPDPDLDDLCSTWFNFEGPWTDKEKKEFESKCSIYSGNWYDEDSNNNGYADWSWAYDYQTDYDVEDEQIWIKGSKVKYNIISKVTGGWVIQDWKP